MADLGIWKTSTDLSKEDYGVGMTRITFKRVSRKIRRRPVTFFWVGALFIAICLFCTYSEENNVNQVYLTTDRGQTKLILKDSSDVYSWPRCEQNQSAASITNFNTLPNHIQDFLYHKHCRHFPMMLDMPDKCGGADGSEEIFLLLVIKSSPENYDRREVLRKTWAKERTQDGASIRRIFITGTTSSGYKKERLNQILALEHRQYNDILQWDFTDTFFNLTLKQVLFLEWMQRNCQNARFLLNGDDDVFAHTENMIMYLKTLQDISGNKHFFAGDLIENVGPIRSKNSKYYIPVQLHESESYPPYLSGGGYLLSRYTASVIYNVSHSIDFLPIDDVYMGMCILKAGLSPERHMGVKTRGIYWPSSKIDKYDPCLYRELLLIHRLLLADMYFMWQRVHDPNLKCGKIHWWKRT